MGYTTYFDGSWKISPELTPDQVAYLEAFNHSRRVKRDPAITELRPDPMRVAVGLPVGIDGGYFVAEDGSFGQDKGPDVMDGNLPPRGQPGLWCGWKPLARDAFGWDDGEKFYDYTDWIAYLIEHFFEPWGRKLNGIVDWNGEEQGDLGQIHIVENVIVVKHAVITYQ